MTRSVSPSHRSLPPLQQWHRATWEDYCNLRDDPTFDWGKLSFHQGQVWVEMRGKGINHASCSDLITILFFVWAMQYPEPNLQSLGRCLLEKPQAQACAPDLVIYAGDNVPRWKTGEPRRIDLSIWPVPNLVGEISDTTLASDLDEQKHLYEALGIPEYWVVDVQGERVFAFGLNDQGCYQECDRSLVLTGLPISLITDTLRQLRDNSNTRAATWFAQQLQTLDLEGDREKTEI